MRFQDKVAIVTGGAGGIGAACVRAFAREGAKVVFTDLKDGKAISDECGADFFQHDATDETGWIDLVDHVAAKHGRLDVVVNNAGIFRPGSIEDTTVDLFREVIDANLLSVMLGCREAVRAMKGNPGGPSGAIVNVSSITGFVGLGPGLAYTASKGGVRLMSKSVAVHCARAYPRIRCNSVHPGTVDTPMNQAAWDASGDPDGMRAFFAQLQPVGRIADADEMAGAVLFLASDDASYVTGTELVVDGGWLAAAGPL